MKNTDRNTFCITGDVADILLVEETKILKNFDEAVEEIQRLLTEDSDCFVFQKDHIFYRKNEADSEYMRNLLQMKAKMIDEGDRKDNPYLLEQATIMLTEELTPMEALVEWNNIKEVASSSFVVTEDFSFLMKGKDKETYEVLRISEQQVPKKSLYETYIELSS